MGVPKYDELMKPLLVALSDGEAHRMRDVEAMLAKQLNLTEQDLAERLPSDRQTVFRNRIGWAKTYLNKAGLIEATNRGVYVITEAGKRVVADNPEKIDRKYLELFPVFRDFFASAVSGEAGSSNSDSAAPMPAAAMPADMTPDDQLEDAYRQIHASLASDLLSEVLKISPYTFEKLVVDLLSKMGYGTVAY